MWAACCFPPPLDAAAVANERPLPACAPLPMALAQAPALLAGAHVSVLLPARVAASLPAGASPLALAAAHAESACAFTLRRPLVLAVDPRHRAALWDALLVVPSRALAPAPSPVAVAEALTLRSDVARSRFNLSVPQAAATGALLELWMQGPPSGGRRRRYRQELSTLAAVVACTYLAGAVDARPEANAQRALPAFERLVSCFLGELTLEPAAAASLSPRAQPPEARRLSAVLEVLAFFDVRLHTHLAVLGLEAELWAHPFLATLCADTAPTLADATRTIDAAVAAWPDSRFADFLAVAAVVQARSTLLAATGTAAGMAELQRLKQGEGTDSEEWTRVLRIALQMWHWAPRGVGRICTVGLDDEGASLAAFAGATGVKRAVLEEDVLAGSGGTEAVAERGRRRQRRLLRLEQRQRARLLAGNDAPLLRLGDEEDDEGGHHAVRHEPSQFDPLAVRALPRASLADVALFLLDAQRMAGPLSTPSASVGGSGCAAVLIDLGGLAALEAAAGRGGDAALAVAASAAEWARDAREELEACAIRIVLRGSGSSGGSVVDGAARSRSVAVAAAVRVLLRDRLRIRSAPALARSLLSGRATAYAPPKQQSLGLHSAASTPRKDPGEDEAEAAAAQFVEFRSPRRVVIVAPTSARRFGVEQGIGLGGGGPGRGGGALLGMQCPLLLEAGRRGAIVVVCNAGAGTEEELRLVRDVLWSCGIGLLLALS